MSKEAAIAFCQIVADNVEVQTKIKSAIASGNEPDFVAIGKDRGFDFTESEALGVLQDIDREGAELSDFELEMVSGGNIAEFDT